MACGATLKRHREFDPLQKDSPDRSPKRIRLPIDLMSPSSPHSRLLNDSAFVEAAQKLIHAARKSPSRENINNSLLRSNNYAESSVASPSFASQAWPTGQSLDTSHAWPSAQSTDARQAWPTAVQSSDARQVWPTAVLSSDARQAWPTSVQSSDASQVWPNNGFRLRSVRQPQQKEQLFTMRQMEAICKIIVNEQMEKVVDEFNNILASEAASQAERLRQFNQTQIHNRFEHSDASYVS